MSRSPKPRPKAKSAPREGRRLPADTMHFDDAGRVRALAGPGHENFAVLEAELGVRVEAPGGGQVVVMGEEARARTDAGRVLNALYARLGEGLLVDPAAVRAACLMSGDAPAEALDTIIRVPRGASFAARTPGQGEYVRALKDDASFDMVFGVGPAGTGKTLLAVAQGASLLAQGAVERLVITRPAVEAGERLGFLPGDLTEKIDPYLLPIWDALRDALGQRLSDKFREEGRVEVAPLAFMRGRTLNRAFIVVDEAQNATIPQMRMVLTRLGEGSRMAVTGDPTQTDLRRGEPSGLAHALGILDAEPRIAIHRFTRADVVRHGLVARIVDAYERDDALTQGREGS
ncbi:PhoH family protein [Alkalicaulis satelles]|uniref:PhoH-like protein n=2 Tax=Alkalicaulis satelles TaxID=2609175 RepID=A0A5M6ZMH1_9PROT|nr:PhoH family protein [Alkalicaulis satelles]KAA5803481.1 PhoH family protein [Alkalicaulis satelles]